MNYSILKPRKALNKAFLKVKANRNEIELFKGNLAKLIDSINESESEEHHKNLVSDFLKNTYYGAAHSINTKGRNDLVIHNGSKATDSVGVIIEAKSPTNRAEMMSCKNVNTKAFHELVLYYLRERITLKNLEVKHLVVTNIYEWFVFDAAFFEREFAQNKKLVKQFVDFEEGRLAGKTTDFFYKHIAEPAIEEVKHEVAFTHFDIRDYEKPLRNTDKKDDSSLIALFKLLSPEHLLKLPFANDSNSLDKSFYTELLHIIGLVEIKEGGKKLIQRKKEGDRNEGSLMESAIFQLDNLDKISRLEKPLQFGEAKNEQLFNIALELTITWVNRILFLKLLEAQLIRYHKGDRSYAFLNTDKVRNFDDLNNLFFSVLARRPQERNDKVKVSFAKVPYLNSSLFEPTELEQTGLFISQLTDGMLPLLSSTVIKSASSQKRTGELLTIEYIFEFLNAYDFASEGREEIQEENKRLINASVLGLIFEKINGYKDGSFFTPGFITMYMCRETIRRAVLQKFKEVKGWDCDSLNQLYDRIDDKQEANTIINSLKICDPSVGSGHFLVSALNEMIAIKSELKILLDRQGKTLRDYIVEVQNDELIVTDDDGDLFEYNPTNRESQRVQETLFHEKQTIIENCLFGVDINPNSVKICRLRLWIELLKNAYYREPDYTELETLPNIDINIKCGNSLISRYPLDADIKKALERSKWTIDSYRFAVMSYRNAKSKDEKHEFEQLIKLIKSDFESEIAKNDPHLVELKNNKGKLFRLTNQTSMFERNKAQTAKWEKDVNAHIARITTLETTIEKIRSGKLFENAFEWRFEFPEVLNDEGDFVGFDVVIGNPPYIRQEELKSVKPYLQTNYATFVGTADIYVYFVERGMNILRNGGSFIYILPNKWMRAGYGRMLRGWLKQYSINSILDFGDLPVFDEATTYPSICVIKKEEHVSEIFNSLLIETLSYPNGLSHYFNENKIGVVQRHLKDEGWILVNNTIQELLNKIKSKGVLLGEYVNGNIYRGILTGYNEAFVIDAETKDQLISEDYSNAEIIKPFLAGKDIKRYQQPTNNKWLILFKSGYTRQVFGSTNEEESWSNLSSKYHSICKHLSQFEISARKRTDKGEFWWELRPCSYYNDFENEKIVWPETSLDNQFTLIDRGVYLNKTTFFIPSNNFFLLGLLNSSIARFFLDSIVSKMRGGYFSLSKAYVETFPVVFDAKLSEHICSIVEKILAVKKEDSTADTTILETQIDQLVYQLYGLTEDEIRIVEGGANE